MGLFAADHVNSRLKEDVSERNDLAKSRPDKVDELHGILVAWRERTGAPIPRVKNPRFDPAVEARDRSKLGTEPSNRKRRGSRQEKGGKVSAEQ